MPEQTMRICTQQLSAQAGIRSLISAEPSLFGLTGAVAVKCQGQPYIMSHWHGLQVHG